MIVKSYRSFLRKYAVFISLVIAVCLSLFLSIYNIQSNPPGFNSDEAAFGYNAYSILQTGKDEYGSFMPFRFKSFGEYKMPLYGYLSVPFIASMGLSELSTRILNIVLSTLFPILIFFLTKELFQRKSIAVISALLTSTSLGLTIVARHAHEAFLGVFLLTIASYFFIKFLKSEKVSTAVYFSVSLLLGLFAYQAVRIYAVAALLFAVFYFFKKRKFTKPKTILIGLLILVIGFFAYTDVMNKPNRVQNLLLFTNQGFALKVTELRAEGGSIFFYNKATIGLLDVLKKQMTYYSPQFLAGDGDTNDRFGYKDMYPMTPLVYSFVFVGLYFIFKNKEKFRYFLLTLLLISPLSASLAWTDISLTRSLFLFIPLLITSAYGIDAILMHKKIKNNILLSSFVLLFMQTLFLFYSWNFYLNHYPYRSTVIRSWQAGYAELGEYLKDKYSTKDTFYITRKNGQPYIYTLFYLKYPPADYQKSATLSELDEYGFGQVEKYDKFIFSLPQNAINEKNAVLIGYPDDFNQFPTIPKESIKVIKVGSEEIFWIYET